MTHREAVLAQLPKNADQILNVELAKPALLPKENVFVEEDMTEIRKQEDVKISTSVWLVLSLYVELMLSAKIYLEVMSVNAQKDSLATLLVGAKNAHKDPVLVNLLMSRLEINANWQVVAAAAIANQRKPNVLRSQEESAIVLVLQDTKQALMENVLMSMNVQADLAHLVPEVLNVSIRKVRSPVPVLLEHQEMLTMEFASL